MYFFNDFNLICACAVGVSMITDAISKLPEVHSVNSRVTIHRGKEYWFLMHSCPSTQCYNKFPCMCLQHVQLADSMDLNSNSVIQQSHVVIYIEG